MVQSSILVTSGIKGQNSEELGPTTVDVERPDLPVKLEAADGMMNQCNQEMWFSHVGAHTRLSIYGAFSEGKEVEVTHSTYLKLLSGNTDVVRIPENETVTSAGPGRTSVIATYSLGGQNIRIMVPLKVEAPSSGVIPAPWTLDPGNVAVTSTSEPHTVTLTNQTDSPVSIPKLETGGIFKETDNCTEVPLAAGGGTCTRNVTFSADRVGPQHLKVSTPNDSYSGPSILLLGNGV